MKWWRRQSEKIKDIKGIYNMKLVGRCDEKGRDGTSSMNEEEKARK